MNFDAATCQRALDGVGSGIGASLRAVDCAAGQMAEAAFGRLFGADGMLTIPLTILLTLFIALLGFGFITGRVRIGLSSLTPRMMTLILVVTFATNWVAFQSVFWNLAVGAPDEIAGVLMGTQGSATNIFADKLDVVLMSLMEASGGEAMDTDTSLYSPPGLLWAGATMLLLGTVGVLATSKIALAVLMALGPIFIVMALFNGTRGLFTGWLKGVVLLAIAPLFAVLAGSLMLELAVPVLSGLMATPGQIDVRPAMAFFMIGAVHLALMFMVMKVAATMVAGWSLFGLAGNDSGDARGASSAAAQSRAAQQPALTNSTARDRASGSSAAPVRDIRITGSALAAANDTGGSYTTIRETKVVGGSASAYSGQSGPSPISRARGIGSRFKSAPIRSTEKMQ